MDISSVIVFLTRTEYFIMNSDYQMRTSIFFGREQIGTDFDMQQAFYTKKSCNKYMKQIAVTLFKEQKI